MAMLCRGLHIPSPIQALTESTPLPWLISFRNKFTKARIPQEILDERSQEHEKYGGNQEQPHKLHVVTRVKSTMRRPYWEKKLVEGLCLQKAYVPVIHKNIPSVNNQLKFIKHLVRIQPLKLPHGLPAEEDMADTYLNSKGELIVRRLLKPVGSKAIES
ncbi:large ribosomal subunit protein uL30m isoform 1-T4 [Salvelinus alpinus]|uniref:large ribosomal subunit protein uL30m n=1 Tax=Salvelinus sp. IW2-2015 TaxID=2691554 RepID=UPI000CDF9497|nr:39S ribosomal protein L30, mitochondrial [Salvelinus alpinus]